MIFVTIQKNGQGYYVTGKTDTGANVRLDFNKIINEIKTIEKEIDNLEDEEIKKALKEKEYALKKAELAEKKLDNIKGNFEEFTPNKSYQGGETIYQDGEILVAKKHKAGDYFQRDNFIKAELREGAKANPEDISGGE